MDGLFFLLNLVRRLKPLPCHRRATAKPNSFEFGTAVARRLEQALVTTLLHPFKNCTLDWIDFFLGLGTNSGQNSS